MRNFAYRQYIKLNVTLGSALCGNPSAHQPHESELLGMELPGNKLPSVIEVELKRRKIQEREIMHIDDLATRLGNEYRGAGVLISVLAVGIILCGLTPSALSLVGNHAKAVAVVEVTFMLATLLVIVLNKKTKTKWIATRTYAEHLRYLPLKKTIDSLVQEPTLAKAVLLKTQLLQITSAQQQWNKSKAEQYHAIEHFADLFTWIGFSIALVFSMLHFVFHQTWFSYLTIGLPVSIGAVHATNGFLKIEELKESYSKMHTKLSGMLVQVNRCDLTAQSSYDAAIARLINLAEETRSVLAKQDKRWSATALKLGLRPS